MSIVTLTVSDIESRTVTTRFGPKNTYTLVATDGTKYSYPFTDPARSGIAAGTTISGVVSSDKYGMKLDPKTVTVSSGMVAKGTTPPPAAPATPAKAPFVGRGARSFPVEPTDPDMAIIRQNALTNAVSTVADYVATQPTEKWPTLDEWVEMVISVGVKYAKFSSGQREVEFSRKMAKAGVPEADINAALDAAIDKSEAA